MLARIHILSDGVLFLSKDTLTVAALRTNLIGDLSAAEPMACHPTYTENVGK